MGSINWSWTNQFLFGRNFPEWNENLIISATKYGLLLRLVLKDKKLLIKIILNQQIERIRTLR